MRGDALPGRPGQEDEAQAASSGRSIRWPLALIGAVLGASAFLGTPPAAAAAALTVCPSGCGFTSVQAAIDAAPGGATIVVEAGSYDGSLTVGKSLILRGAGATRTTLRAGGGSGPALTVDPGATVTVTGVTISGGSGPAGGGIRNEKGAELTIKDSAISHNSASELGGGIFNGPGATLAITDSSLAGNTAIYGGGISNETGATLTIKDSSRVIRLRLSASATTIEAVSSRSGSVPDGVTPTRPPRTKRPQPIRCLIHHARGRELPHDQLQSWRLGKVVQQFMIVCSGRSGRQAC